MFSVSSRPERLIVTIASSKDIKCFMEYFNGDFCCQVWAFHQTVGRQMILQFGSNQWETNKIVSCWYYVARMFVCFRKGRKRASLFNVVFNLWNTTVSSWIYLCSTENKGETDAERTKSIRRRKHKLFNKTPKKPNVAIKSVKNGWWQ